MTLASGYNTGDLVKHIYAGEVGILLETRLVDVVHDPIAVYPVYDACVLWADQRRQWVPLELLRKLSGVETN